jgi:hypothetical protein
MLALMCIGVHAQGLEARFTTEKSTYLVGEPVYVVLSISNKSDDTIWVNFGPTDMFCQKFSIEIPGADSAREQWGCGIGGSCGDSLVEVAARKTAAVRQLLNREFRLQRTGAYVVHAQTTVTVRSQNLWSSRPFDEFKVSDNLTVNLQRSDDGELQAAFKPIVHELSSTDLVRRGEAAAAIIETAPPFLEDVLIDLAKTNYGFAAMTALRKVDTEKTRNALAQAAISGGNQSFRVEAIRNLGRTGDTTYFPELLQLIKSPDIQIQSAAAEAIGNLGGTASVKEIAVLLSSANVQTRQAGANGLEYTHSREAIPLLIGLLLDPDAGIRQTAISGLELLTHRVAFDGSQSADVITLQSAGKVHQRWVRWLKSEWKESEIHGMADCAAPKSLD